MYALRYDESPLIPGSAKHIAASKTQDVGEYGRRSPPVHTPSLVINIALPLILVGLGADRGEFGIRSTVVEGLFN